MSDAPTEQQRNTGKPGKPPSRGGMIVLGLMLLAGAFFCGRLLFVRHDSAPRAIAPGAKDLDENAWVIARGHVDAARLQRVARLGDDLFVFPLVEHGDAFFVIASERDVPALADPALWKPGLLSTILKEHRDDVRPQTIAFLDGEQQLTGVIDVAGSGLQKPGVVEYRDTKIKLTDACRGCSGPLRALKLNDEPTGRAWPAAGCALLLLFAFAAFRGAARLAPR